MSIQAALSTFQADMKVLITSGKAVGQTTLKGFEDHVDVFVSNLKAFVGTAMTQTQFEAARLEVIKAASLLASQLNLSDASKKQYCLDAASRFFDKAYPLVPVPAWATFFKSYYQAGIKKEYMLAADATIEFAYNEITKVLAPSLPATIPVVAPVVSSATATS